MKQSLLLLTATTILFACSNSQSKAVDDAKKAQTILKAMEPGGIATTESGWMMTAKLNGKTWTASSMMSPDVTDRIIGKLNDESISLPYSGRKYLVVGEKTKFGESHAVDLFTNDDVAIWGGRTGEMEITKVDGNWAEGKFFFTATASGTDKKVEVTEGFFRISLTQNQ
jgi:hypothetical protein